MTAIVARLDRIIAWLLFGIHLLSLLSESFIAMPFTFDAKDATVAFLLCGLQHLVGHRPSNPQMLL